MRWRLLSLGLVGFLSAACGSNNSSTGGPSAEALRAAGPGSGPVTLPTCATPAGQVVTLGHEGSVSGLGAAAGVVVVDTGASILGMPLAGGAATTLATPSSAHGLWLLGDSLYFTAEDLVGPVDAQGKRQSSAALYQLPRTGGQPTLLMQPAPSMEHAALDADAVYFPSPGSITGVVRFAPASASMTDLRLEGTVTVDALAVDDAYLYAAVQVYAPGSDITTGAIQRVPKAGGPAQTLVANIGHPWSLVVDQGGLYWVEEPPVGQFGNAKIEHAALDGSGVTTVMRGGANALALDANFLYFASDAIGALPRAGGDPTMLATGLQQPGYLTVVGANLVWVNNATRAMSDATPMAVQTTCVPVPSAG